MKSSTNLRKFILLWAGELISSIGGGLTSFGLGVYIFQQTGSAAGMALAFPNLFQKLGGALLGVLFGLVLCEIVLLILGRDQIITAWVAAALFSLYIGFDVYRSQQFPKTVDNAVDCALDIYMDIANLFLRILQILGKRKD